MFKSIFSKLIAIFIFILIFCFSVTGVMLYFFLDNFTTEQKENDIYQSTERINASLNIYFAQIQKIDSFRISEDYKNYLKSENESSFESDLESYGDLIHSIIWIVDENGQIIFGAKQLSEKTYGKFRNEAGFIQLPDERQYSDIMSGRKQQIKVKGDFFSFFKSEVPFLSIGRPLVYEDNGNTKIIGAIYFHTPVPELKKARESVLKFFMISMGIAILISVILVYVFSRRFVRPLRQINNAAKIIAGGEFRNRLDIKSQDEIGELANSFNQMVISLQNLEEMRRGFIANVSHELRTPMTSIRGFIEGILDGTIPPERQKDYLIIVKNETNRLNRLVNDLLDLAKMEAGEISLTLRNFNINELLRLCIIKLEGIITEKNIQIDACFYEEEVYVNADRDAIERVVINLLHNAIKFTDENGQIGIMTQREKDKVLVTIKDNGIGISENEVNLIWDRFYKADKSRSHDKTGTGLGLAIVKNIILEHKQEIWVKSELGKGTGFTFSLESVDAKSKSEDTPK